MSKLFLVTYGFYIEMSMWKPYITGTFYTKILMSGLLFKIFCEKLANYSIISVMLYMTCKTIQKFQKSLIHSAKNEHPYDQHFLLLKAALWDTLYHVHKQMFHWLIKYFWNVSK